MDNLGLLLNELSNVYDCGLTKIRVGNQHDGGYIVLKEICEKTEKVYSFGIGNDIGFEMDFVKKFPNAKIECFDPTIESLPAYPENMFTDKIYYRREGPKSLTDIFDNSLLKMDIEGNEWDAIGSTEMFNLKNLMKFSQIIIGH